jgi:protein-tyrosine phosphatase
MSLIDCAKVIPHLFIGSAKVAKNKTQLDYLQINTIINCSIEVDNFFENDKKYKYINLFWKDNFRQNILVQLDPLCEKIYKEVSRGRNVFVHCYAGISRSASIIIAYLIKYNQMTYYSAYKHLHSIRSIINPNSGFIEQLKIFNCVIHYKKFKRPVVKTKRFGITTGLFPT